MLTGREDANIMYHVMDFAYTLPGLETLAA